MSGSTSGLKIAVQGCGHGSLDTIYQTLEQLCESRGWTLAELDFLIICGDFQAVRNELDLNCMSVPKKYLQLGDFHQYYSGAKLAPVLTIVIGGNHEASNYFSELYRGGWLAPNIYYLGDANVLRYGPFRIAGLSGIYKGGDYDRPRQARLPYERREIHSIYHVRESDVSKLLQVRSPIDIGLSHDWPRRVEWFGDYETVFKERPHWFDSAKTDTLGSQPAEQVMNYLRPQYWFSGHMHMKFSADVKHKGKLPQNIFSDLAIPDEWQSQLPRSMFRASVTKTKGAPKYPPPGITNTVTHFLALSKPGPVNDFLELIEVGSSITAADPSTTSAYLEKTPEGKFSLHYDEEWLSILRSSDRAPAVPNDDVSIQLERDWVYTNITAKGLLKVPENFEKHAPVYNPNETVERHQQPKEYPNSQTEHFCNMVGIGNKFSDEEEAVAEDDDLIVFG